MRNPNDTNPGRVFITGATGFVGRALVQRLLGAGYEVTAWVRDPTTARSKLGPDVALCPIVPGAAELDAALAEADAVVNLAGENVMGGRWTPRRKRALRQSRVDLTTRLVMALGRVPVRKRVLVSASAVGYYGDRGDTPLDEQSPQGEGFLAELCRDWEDAAFAAKRHGVRVACLRIGLVLGHGGGVMQSVLPAFRFGLGGPLGNGAQYMPWIALDDLVGAIAYAMEDDTVDGVLNATAPEPVTSRAFATQLGAALGRPAVLPAPAFALHALLGQRARVVLQGQRALPARLLEQGFDFRYRRLPDALQGLLDDERGVDIRKVTADDDAPAGARYVLSARTTLRVPPEQGFAFFGAAANLGLITPPFMGFHIIDSPAQMAAGAEINYRIKLGPIPMRWRTRIPHWEPPRRFVDNQEQGPYALWWHEHLIQPSPEGCVMLDRVYYAPPLGLLGRLVHGLFIAPTLRTIFAYRQACIARMFGRRSNDAASASTNTRNVRESLGAAE